jgi:hypothetical protein
MMSSLYGDITPCGPLTINGRSPGARRLQVRRIRQENEPGDDRSNGTKHDMSLEVLMEVRFRVVVF